jgi:hypothetical protein
MAREGDPDLAEVTWPILTRFDADQLAALDRFIASQPVGLSRGEAARLLVAEHLTLMGDLPLRRGSHRM